MRRKCELLFRTQMRRNEKYIVCNDLRKTLTRDNGNERARGNCIKRKKKGDKQTDSQAEKDKKRVLKKSRYRNLFKD